MHHIASGMFMFKRMFVILAAVLVSVCANAQTPVEELIQKYDGADGARSFNAHGLSMKLARKMISNTPVGPVASDVTEVAVLKMAGVQPSVQKRFVSDLEKVLKDYKYYGEFPSKNGDVDVYVMYSGPRTVDELVVYNPSVCSLISLYGNFPEDSLLKIAQQAKQ